MTSTPENITCLALDVDGVLTDGTLIFEPTTGKESKPFHVHDGLGISLWQKAGFHVIIISGRNAQCVSIRANELNINHLIQGSKDKVGDLQAVLLEIGATFEQTAFVGDDLGDIALMRRVGYAIAVQSAVEEVIDAAHWTTTKEGGRGAVREAIKHLMEHSGTWKTAVQSLQSEPAHQ